MASITEIRSIVELYVGWFNRIPDSEGFDFWVGRLDQGSSLAVISNEFFESAVHQFSAETGYTAGMTDDAFITQLYDGVMGRTGDLAPNAEEIGYWAGKLNGEFAGDKGAMVVQMIEEIKAFDATGNDAIKAVQDKFNNKVQLALEIVALPDAPGFVGTIEEGKDLLNTITEDDATVQAAFDSYLATSINFPTFELTPTTEDVKEGSVAEFTLTTENVADGTEVAYTLSGITVEDLASGELTGTAVVENGTATIAVELAEDTDNTEVETLTVTIDGESASAEMPIVDTSPVYHLAADADSIKEGDLDNFGNTATFTLTTENVADGTEVAYTLSGITEEDLASGGLTGTATVENGTATISVELLKDAEPNEDETLTVSIDADPSVAVASTMIMDAMTSVNGNAALNATFTADKDIKTTNDKIEIRDVSNDITINYDANTLQADDDHARIEIGEVPTTQTPIVSLDLTEGAGEDAAIETVTLTSSRNEEGGNEVTVNTLSAFSVGDALATLNIDGAATDTEIEAALDRMVTTVDANALEGNLTLNLTAALKDVTYIGAQGNDEVTFDTPAEDDNGDDLPIAVDVDEDGEVDFNSVQNNHNISGNAGNDTFKFAEDGLTIGDTISGGEGEDTIVITERDDIQRSETEHVSGVETIDLLESGSLLVVTDNLVTGGDEGLADTKTFTVDTTSQDADEEFEPEELDISVPVSEFSLDNPDREDDGHIIDVTEVTTVASHGFTYQGGGANDALLIKDAQLNSKATLDFGDGLYDQMRIVNGATVTGDDFDNISGLEAIVLVADSTQSQTWSIELNESVFADDKNPDLAIYIDPTVPQGSVLNLSGSGLGSLTVYSNSNITVNGLDPVNNIEQHEFTENAEDLDGTDLSDTFHATSLDQITVADIVDAKGNDDFVWGAYDYDGDTLQLDFALANGNDTVSQLLNPTLLDFETVDFNTNNKVAITSNTIDFGKYYLGTNADIFTVGDAGQTEVYMETGTAQTNTDVVGDVLNVDSFNLQANDRLNGDTAVTTQDDDDVLTTELVNTPNENDWLILNADVNTAGKVVDEQFTNVSNFETLQLGVGSTIDAEVVASGDDVIAGGREFEETKLGQFTDGVLGVINGNNGNDQIAFTNETALTLANTAFADIEDVDFGSQGGVSQHSNLNIDAGAGDDTVAGGAGDDTIADGEGSDIIIGSTGADTINLSGDSTTDFVTFTRAEDGAKTGQGTDFDVVNNFALNSDKIAIEGTLLAAIDSALGGGDNNNAVNVVETNEAALTLGDTELAVYANNSLVDAELTDLSNSGELLTYLNNNLALADQGQNVIYSVQGDNDTGIYFYQENTGDNIADQSEIRMLALVEDSLLTANDFAAASVFEPVVNINIIDINQDDAVGTGEADIFTFAPAEVAQDGIFNVTDFDVANDVIVIDLPDVFENVDSLDDLLGVANGALGNINIAADPFANKLVATFGEDPAAGALITLEMAGITNAADVAVTIV